MKYQKVMRKLFFISSLFIIPGTVSGQNNQNLKFIDLMVYSEKPSDLMYQVTSIIPVGWSQAGYFAYISMRPVEGRGGIIYQYIVFDCVNDKIVWTKSHDTFDYENTEDDFEISCSRNKAAFDSVLNQYKIQQGQGTAFKELPYTSPDNSVFSVELNTQKRTKKEFFTGDIESLTVYIVKNPGKKKRVYHKTDSKAFSYWPAGYFISPFENRILIVIGEELFGFEGTEGDFIFTGCHLDVGFE